MDTNVSAHADIEPGTDTMSARLPGEADTAPSEPAAPEIGAPLVISGGKLTQRDRLLLGAAVVVMVAVAVAVGGAFLVSPYNHLYPVPRLKAAVEDAAGYAEDRLRPIVAPAAALAKVSVPPAPPVTKETYTPKSRDKQLAELLSLHSGAAAGNGPSAKAPTAAPSPPPGTPDAGLADPGAAGEMPHEPGSPGPVPPIPPLSGAAGQPVAGAKDATAQIVTALAQGAQAAPSPVAGQADPGPEASRGAALPSTAPIASPPQGQPPATPATGNAATARPATTAQDPLIVANSLRAAPMTPPDQVQVLNLVTEIAAMVKDLRRQDADMRADFAKSSGSTAARLADFERRLTLAEAQTAVAAAGEASVNPPFGVASLPAGAQAPVVIKPLALTTVRPVAAAQTPAPSAPKTYRVQAASPGLALLAQTDRGGGEGAQLQVAVGDTVPDYGRVKSIAQKGTTWVVTTDHGQIQ